MTTLWTSPGYAPPRPQWVWDDFAAILANDERRNNVTGTNRVSHHEKAPGGWLPCAAVTVDDDEPRQMAWEDLLPWERGAR